MPELLVLDGRLALVTGASRGIGRAVTLRLAEAGCNLILVARDIRALDETAAKVRPLGRTASTFAYDLADVAGIERLYAHIREEAGTPDILVNNAGITKRAPAHEIDLETWRSVMNVNVDAVFELSKTFSRALIATGRGGSIVNIASLMCEASRAGTAAYTASKGAIRQLTKALALEWATYGIRVNAVGPGYIETEMTEPLRQDEKLNAWVLSRTPMGRWGRPEEIANAVLFLVSPAASFITGHILYVDGGFLASL